MKLSGTTDQQFIASNHPLERPRAGPAPAAQRER